MFFPAARACLWCCGKGGKRLDPVKPLPNFVTYDAYVGYIIGDLSMRVYMEVRTLAAGFGIVPSGLLISVPVRKVAALAL